MYMLFQIDEGKNLIKCWFLICRACFASRPRVFSNTVLRVSKHANIITMPHALTIQIRKARYHTALLVVLVGLSIYLFLIGWSVA